MVVEVALELRRLPGELEELTVDELMELVAALRMRNERRRQAMKE